MNMGTKVASVAEPVALDEYGFAIWRHRYSKTLFVERRYHYCDRVLVIEEIDNYRHVVDDTKFSTFNFSDWIPVTVVENKKIKRFNKDIYK
jgi:hypothetical protein